jgi:sucrose-6-phosphate hydrolase SacC (GH32 family)
MLNVTKAETYFSKFFKPNQRKITLESENNSDHFWDPEYFFTRSLTIKKVRVVMKNQRRRRVTIS